MDPIFVILFVAIGGVMIGAGVHFIPVGGAPAAMATATGVGTGTAMLAAGAGLTGLITAATMTGEPWFVVGIGGAIGAMIMMGITMLIANFIYVYGVGIVPAALPNVIKKSIKLLVLKDTVYLLLVLLVVL